MLISNTLLGDSPSLPQTMTSISINYEWVMYKIKTHNIVNFFMNLNMPKNVCMNDHIHVFHFVLESLFHLHFVFHLLSNILVWNKQFEHEGQHN